MTQLTVKGCYGVHLELKEMGKGEGGKKSNVVFCSVVVCLGFQVL